MTRDRNKENKGLPDRWRYKNGAYRYRPKKGTEHFWDNKKEFTLGTNLSDAWQVWAERTKAKREARTIGQLLDRYSLEVVPKKKPRTQIENRQNIIRLKETFGNTLLEDLSPTDIYEYYDRRSAKTQAVHEISILSHAFVKAIKWGYIKRHPFKHEVELEHKHKPRTRYVEDAEIEAAMSLKPLRKGDSTLMVQAYIRLKLLTGLRMSDLLRIQIKDLKDDGIHITPSKTDGTTGKAVIFTWTEALRKAADDVMGCRPAYVSPWLFCTRRGECYVNKHGIPEGFKSSWQRFMDRLLAEELISERFTEHDIRAKTGSDSDSDEDAQKRLTHSDVKITRKHYRRKAEKVSPLK